MHKLWLVIRREYLTRLYSRTFLLSTLGIPLAMVAMFALPLWIASRNRPRTLQVAVVDHTGRMGAELTRALEQPEPDTPRRFHVVQTIERPDHPAAVRQQLRQTVVRKQLDGFLVIPPDVLRSGQVEFVTRNASDSLLKDTLAKRLTPVVIAWRFADRQIRWADVEGLTEPVQVSVVRTSGQGETEERGQAFAPAILLAAVLYSSLLMYGITTMRSVIEEKATRIMEILLSSVDPVWLMAGKILGVGAIGLTQYLLWAIVGAVLTTYAGVATHLLNPGTPLPRPHLPLQTWLWFVVFFLFGYLLYASLYAAVGAAVSSEQDATQLQLPITMLVVASFALFSAVTSNPSSLTAILLSEIPFFAPILMVLRIALEPPPLSQILLSVGLLASTTAVIVYAAARIYRVGVLVYGKRPSVIEILRWLRYA